VTTPLRIKVMKVDGETSKPEANARVIVGRQDLIGDSVWPYDDVLPTHTHVGDGHYLNVTGDPENEPKSGQFILVVKADDCAPVVQRLTFAESNGAVRAQPGWGERGSSDELCAATVNIVNYGEAKQEVDAELPQFSLVTVSLFPLLQYVAVACQDKERTDFPAFSRGRRNRLFEQGKLNQASIAHIFLVREKVVEISAKAQSPSPEAWVTLERRKLPPREGPSDRLPPDAVSITSFYDLLEDIGKKQKGTLVEGAFFGHAWHQGPLVVNTFDESSEMLVRDTQDTDGRPKDFDPEGPLKGRVESIDAAFSKEGKYIVYGCSHMANVFRETFQALKRLPDGARDAFFSVPLIKGGRVNTTLDYTKRSFAQYVLSTRLGRFEEHGDPVGNTTYLAMAARALKTPLFGAPQGCEANFGAVKSSFSRGGKSVSHLAMLIRQAPNSENDGIIKYLEAEFADALERDDLGYLNYTNFIAKAEVPDPGWHTQRFSIMPDPQGFKALRLPSRLLVARDSKGQIKGPVAHEQFGETGHLYELPRCAPVRVEIREAPGFPRQHYVLTGPSNQLDIAFFVTETGKTFMLGKKVGVVDDFHLPNEGLPPTTMKLLYDPFWDIDESAEPVPALEPPGLIEMVTPRWFW
jgi:hypothetical protein